MLLMQWLLLLVLLSAAMATCAIGIVSGSSDIGHIERFACGLPILLFAILPYVFLGSLGLRARTSIQVVVILLGSILLGVYGVTSLHVRLSRHDDALGGVWLFVVPICQWLACAVVALLTSLLHKTGSADRSASGLHDDGRMAMPRDTAQYDEMPWYRRSGVLSKCVAVGIIIPPALLPVCIAVLTGPVYYKEMMDDGTLRKWTLPNKAAALALLVLEGYLYGAMLGVLPASVYE